MPANAPAGNALQPMPLVGSTATAGTNEYGPKTWPSASTLPKEEAEKLIPCRFAGTGSGAVTLNLPDAYVPLVLLAATLM